MTLRPSNCPSLSTRDIYLDNSATTQALPEVIEAVSRAMAHSWGNASSVHSAGERARLCLRGAREQVAMMLGASIDDVVFTSGATEANNLVLQSLLTANCRGYRLVTTSIEHSSVLAAADHLHANGVEVVILAVDRNGLVDQQNMIDAIKPGSTLVSIQWASNETGVLQPLVELAKRAQEAGAQFHTDAVQAVGKVPINLAEAPIDFLSLSGHKVHGPLGVGALVGPGVHTIHPLLFGGSQEQAVRPGTENIPGIVGLGTALELRSLRFDSVAVGTRTLRDRFEQSLKNNDLIAAINGTSSDRLPNTTNVQFSEIDGEALILRLDQAGIRCSQGSACTNQKPEPSYVLRAMGLSEAEAYASVRFSLSELNTVEEIDSAVESIMEIHASLTRFAVA